MEKPIATTEHDCLIMFNASASAIAVDKFQRFGRVTRIGMAYLLAVDSRYDFDEALAYIEHYWEDE